MPIPISWEEIINQASKNVEKYIKDAENHSKYLNRSYDQELKYAELATENFKAMCLVMAAQHIASALKGQR